jgi:hypothetical protein
MWDGNRVLFITVFPLLLADYTKKFFCHQRWLKPRFLEKSAKRLTSSKNSSSQHQSLENNPVGAWLRDYYDITGRRDDIVQKTELYKAFLEDTQMHKTQKAFSEDMVKCGVSERKTGGERYCFGLVRKE